MTSTICKETLWQNPVLDPVLLSSYYKRIANLGLHPVNNLNKISDFISLILFREVCGGFNIDQQLCGSDIRTKFTLALGAIDIPLTHTQFINQLYSLGILNTRVWFNILTKTMEMQFFGMEI